MTLENYGECRCQIRTNFEIWSQIQTKSLKTFKMSLSITRHFSQMQKKIVINGGIVYMFSGMGEFFFLIKGRCHFPDKFLKNELGHCLFRQKFEIWLRTEKQKMGDFWQ